MKWCSCRLLFKAVFLMTIKTLCHIRSADYFLSCAHPKRKHPWLSKNVGVRLGKRPYAWEQNRAILLEPIVYPKCSKLEVYNPGSWYWTFFQSSIKVMTLKSFIYRISCGFTNYSWGLAHALELFSEVHPSDITLWGKSSPQYTSLDWRRSFC